MERSYKILYQRVPPERNSAPGAARAFSRVFRVYKCLLRKFEADEQIKKTRANCQQNQFFFTK